MLSYTKQCFDLFWTEVSNLFSMLIGPDWMGGYSLIQASTMQLAGVWMPGVTPKPGSGCAKGPLRTALRGTANSSVSSLYSHLLFVHVF